MITAETRRSDTGVQSNCFVFSASRRLSGERSFPWKS
jgi:hypothetical protein